MVYPQYIKDYKVTSKSSSEVLITLARFQSEVGGFASSISEVPYQRIGKLCYNRLGKIMNELSKRDQIYAIRELYNFSTVENERISAILTEASQIHSLTAVQLQSLSINDLELMFRYYSNSREREVNFMTFTFYRQESIVDELIRRNATFLEERLKIDYCKETYNNELDNLATILRMPVGRRSDFTKIDLSRDYSATEIQALLDSVSEYATVMERETLMQYADYAVWMIEQSEDLQQVIRLIERIAWLNRRDKLTSGASIYDKLKDAVQQWNKHPTVSDTEIVLPLSTLSHITGDWTYQHKAERIINHCYRECMMSLDDIALSIDKIYISTILRDFISRSRFSVRKFAARWKELCDIIIFSGFELNSVQAAKLLVVGNEVGQFTIDVSIYMEPFIARLSTLADSGDLIAQLSRKYFSKLGIS